jgi:hypothetical protein
MRQHRVQHLLIGGQACVLYGAAEFSRDTDLVVVSGSENLAHLSRALEDLEADVIAVPPFRSEYLEKGHAIHFRCQRDDVRGMRIDVMSKLRGVDPFSTLWDRRTTVDIPEGETLDVLSLPDLVASKKTQRDKDWPMLRRLLEADYSQNLSDATATRATFWLRELRTPSFLFACVDSFNDVAEIVASERPAVHAALKGNMEAIVEALEQEERTEREADKAYWNPLRQELEQLRHDLRRDSR